MSRTSGEEFFKVLLYYLLLLAAVDSVERLRRFMRWLAALAVVVTTIAILQYHGVIDLPGLSEIAQEPVHLSLAENLEMRVRFVQH